MATSRPVEKVMNVTDTKQQFSKVINEVARGESYVTVEKSGAPVAAIISQQELQEYKRLKEKDAEARERLHKALTEFSHQFDDVSDEDLERVLSEARREYREKTDRENGRI
jgi:prevent-host-death family protein